MNIKGLFSTSSTLCKALVILFITLFCISLAGSLSLLIQKGIPFWSESTNLKLMQLVSASLIFIGIPLLSALLLSQRSAKQLFQLNKPKISLLLLGIGIMIVSSPFIDQLSTWNTQLELPSSLKQLESQLLESEHKAQQMTEKMLIASTFGDLILNLLVIGILAGVGEELLFRGGIQPYLIQKTNSVFWGVLLTAMLFSAIHFQFYGFIPRLVLGVILGFLFQWSGSLWVPIIAHAVNNGLIVIFTPSAYNAGNSLIQGASTITHTPLITGVSFCMLSLFLYWVFRNRVLNKNSNNPDYPSAL